MSETTPASLSVCHQCDWVSSLPRLNKGDTALCPRCGYQLYKHRSQDTENEIAWATAALIMLFVALAFEFIRFEVGGVSHSIVFADTVRALFDYDYVLLAVVVLLTTVVLPALYLLIILYLDIGLALHRNLPGTVMLGRILQPISPWLLSDVFIIGVLVSLIKIVTLANIHIGPSFLAFCIYAVLLLKTIAGFNAHRLWQRIADECDLPKHLVPGRTAHKQRVAACRACGQLFDYQADPLCPRCGRRYVAHHINRLQITWALILTATILFIPANLYPILKTESFGNSDPQTIVGGVRHLIETGSWPIALIILVASILIPIAKILALAWLCIKARSARQENLHDKMRLYRMTELIGRWSMIDVFVVAVLVALVQAGVFMTITPGPAVIYFAAVVVITMIAAMTFDTRLIWQSPSMNHETHTPPTIDNTV